jgi:hypothetical protein
MRARAISAPRVFGKGTIRGRVVIAKATRRINYRTFVIGPHRATREDGERQYHKPKDNLLKTFAHFGPIAAVPNEIESHLKQLFIRFARRFHISVRFSNL